MISEVSARTGMPIDDILGRSRVHEIVTVRQLYWKLIREKKCFTVARIGMLCERDHSTIVLGIKHANDLLETNDLYATLMWNKMKGIEP